MLKAVLAVSAALSVAAGVVPHTELKSASPAKHEVLAKAPSRVMLTFTEAVNTKLSTISILTPDSTELAKIVVSVGSTAATFEGPLPRVLPAGKYLVRWKTVSDDGHVLRGAYDFSIAAPKVQ